MVYEIVWFVGDAAYRFSCFVLQTMLDADEVRTFGIVTGNDCYYIQRMEPSQCVDEGGDSEVGMFFFEVSDKTLAF